MPHTVVIGAGMGGLAAAARLAAGGHRVTVCERAGTHGGAVGRHTRDGFAFDTGPGLLTLPAVYRDLFIKTRRGLGPGKHTLESCVELREVDPAVRHVVPGGPSFALPNASRAGAVAALDAALGVGCGERWAELLTRGREVWEAVRRPLFEEPLDDRGPLARDPYVPARRRWLRRAEPTLAEVARRELGHPVLGALLAECALRHGFDPRRAPAALTLLPYVEHTFGTWYVTGGMRALADAVFERCERQGVEFRFGTEVAGVLSEGGRVTGVSLAEGSGRTELSADAVVAGAPGFSAGAAAGGLGRFTVLVALRGRRPEGAVHRTVVHAADPPAELEALFGGSAGTCARPTLQVLRPGDASLVPVGEYETVTLTAVVRPQGAVDWTAPGVAEAYADQLLEAALPAVPDLPGRLLFRDFRTPADTERETGHPGGVVPTPALPGADGHWLAPANRTPLQGLYVTGSTAHPGGGLSHTAMSGALTAGLLGVPG
jgi:phytoene desaturase